MDLRRLDWILTKAQTIDGLTAWETQFIHDLTERRERYGDNINISERQEEILEAIAAK